MIASFSHFRVSGPVTGLKRMPITMPRSRIVPVWLFFSFLPWRRPAALRRSSIAPLSFSRSSSSVATFVASVTASLLRPPSRSLYTSRAVATALITSSRSLASDIARSTYGLTFPAAS